MTIKELRDALLEYAMAADHANKPQFTVSRYVLHDVAVGGTAYKRHEIRVSLPVGQPRSKPQDRPIWLFERLIEALDASGDELLDHFATKLMERLQERQRIDAASPIVKKLLGVVPE
jgi:hypothetical protein